MRFIKNSVLVFALLLSVTTLLQAQNALHPEIEGSYSLSNEDLLRICSLDATDINASYYVPAREIPDGRLKSAKNSVFQVEYVGPSWPEEAKTAFAYAMSIWESHLDSDVPIRIEANWVQLGERTLGSAGPTQILQIVSGEPDTWYSIAQASAITGVDFVSQSQGTEDQIDHDVRININANWDSWYFGTDAQPPAGLIDLVSVVLHEVGHGIGFTGSMRVPNSSTNAQWGYGIPPEPIIYDRFVIDGNGNSVINTEVYNNSSGGLYDAVTGKSGGLYSSGFNTILSNGGTAAKLYAPSEWNGGSSFSHLDQVAYTNTENALMRPQVDRAFAIHTPGPVTCGILNDTGWPLGIGCQQALNEEAFLAVDASDLSFGVTNEGERLVREITLTNPASSPGLLVSRISISGSSSFDIIIPNPIVVLAPGESRLFSITYRPLRQEKANAVVSIDHNGTNLVSPYVITMNGEALASNETFILEQNYPNPFNATTVIPFALSKDARVRLDIYDAMGRLLQTLIDDQRPAGRYSVRLDANEFSSGLYFYRIFVDDKAETGKLLLTK